MIRNRSSTTFCLAVVTGQTELFAADGNDASYSSTWTGWYTPGSHRASGAAIGKSKAYDTLKLNSLTFEVDDGTKIDVSLVGTQYEDMSLLEIVQSTGITASSRNNGQGLWNTGHIQLPITSKVNPNNHKMASTLRIVVGDGSNDGRDFCIFYFNDDNGRYDYHGYSAFGFGSETRYNPGYRTGICSIYGTPATAPVDCPNSAWVYNFEDERCVPKSSNYGLVCRDDGFDLKAHHDIYGGDFSVGSCNFAFAGATGLVTKTFLFADCTPNSYSDANGKNHNEFVAEPLHGMHATLQIFPSINIHCIHQAFTTMTFTLFFEYDSEVIDDLLEYESGNIQNIVSIYSSSSDYMVGSTVHFHIKSTERVDNFVLELVSCTVSSPGNPHSADLFNAAIHPFLKTTVNGNAYSSTLNMDSNIWIGDLFNVDYTGFKFVQEQDEFHHKVSCSLKVKSQSGALGTPPTSSG
jgi:hypothetical protein